MAIESTAVPFQAPAIPGTVPGGCRRGLDGAGESQGRQHVLAQATNPQSLAVAFHIKDPAHGVYAAGKAENASPSHIYNSVFCELRGLLIRR